MKTNETNEFFTHENSHTKKFNKKLSEIILNRKNTLRGLSNKKLERKALKLDNE